MTVISTIISQLCTAHASDSLITWKKMDGTCEIVNGKETKIVIVRHWKGIMSFYGLAEIEGSTLLAWLQRQAAEAKNFSSPEEFATDIAKKLNQELARMELPDPLSKGVGIHFTAYEVCDGYDIPELFHITNFEDPEYQKLRHEGVRATRETYGTAFRESAGDPKHGQPQYRKRIRDYLRAGEVLIYNNGDPFMFNSAMGAVLSLFKIALQRKVLRVVDDPKGYREIISLPIQQVSQFQKNFASDGFQVVGGKIHNLSVTPRGQYDTGTGERT